MLLRVDVATFAAAHAFASYTFFPVWVSVENGAPWRATGFYIVWPLAPFISPLIAAGHLAAADSITQASLGAAAAMYLLPLGIGYAVLYRMDAVRRRRDGHCVSCGYDLRATPDRCPECGRVQEVTA